jgi:anti-sigma regulatory factor (Ser/Thr protein kinase)
LVLVATLDTVPTEHDTAFRHEALWYEGEQGFVHGCTAFIRDGLVGGEPILVVVPAHKIKLLQGALGADADGVTFADMADVGKNPARIIPAWRQFVDAHAGAGRRFRGIGEPIGPDRSPAELAECHRHESLLNLAFADSPPWWLLCPYDTVALDPAVVEEARRTHPLFYDAAARQSVASGHFRHVDRNAPFNEALPEPPASSVLAEIPFSASLREIRDATLLHAEAAGLSRERAADLVLAVNEVATNSLRYGGGDGSLRVWREGGTLICEVRDQGYIDEPLIGREHPSPDKQNGRGLWLANQLCDLVQLHSSSDGTAVRLHMRPQ